MNELSIALVHPAQISESRHLSDDDPLKTAARFLLDDFEALTNGMKRSGKTDESVQKDSDNPLYPWYLLINAVAAFYEGNPADMKKNAGLFPEGTAVGEMKGIFDILAGKPSLPNPDVSFTEKIRTKHKELSDGLEILDEAAAYPNLLRKEIGHYISEMARESTEAARRLYHWAMEVLAEDGPITETDELTSVVPGCGEASRICALTSIRYDPDRALPAWLRSLNAVLEGGDTSPEVITARLKIAGDIMEMAENDGTLSCDVLSAAAEKLRYCYPLMKPLLPSLPPLPDNEKKLHDWLRQAGDTPESGRKQKKRMKRTVETRELFLFPNVAREIPSGISE